MQPRFKEITVFYNYKHNVTDVGHITFTDETDFTRWISENHYYININHIYTDRF